ncbi:unnamed protein product, partial [Rotaria sordida]
MLHTYYYLAIIAIIFCVRSSEAIDCTSTSFQQDLNAAELAASKILADEFGDSTAEQIQAEFAEQFGEDADSINVTVTQVSDTITIEYLLLFNCDPPPITLPDGTEQKQEAKTKVNTTDVENCISAGLTDRTNQIALKNDQIKAGATDTTLEFKAGGSKYFEFVIQIPSTLYTKAISASSPQTAEQFHKVLATFFRTSLIAIYSKTLRDVNFISVKQKSDGRYALTNRVSFTENINNQNLRTEISSNIQKTFYTAINNFKMSAKTISIPEKVQISAPKPVRKNTKKTVVSKLTQLLKSVTSNAKDTSAKGSSATSPDKTSDSSKTKTTDTKTGSTSGSNTGIIANVDSTKQDTKAVKTSGSSVAATSNNDKPASANVPASPQADTRAATGTGSLNNQNTNAAKTQTNDADRDTNAQKTKTDTNQPSQSTNTNQDKNAAGPVSGGAAAAVSDGKSAKTATAGGVAAAAPAGKPTQVSKGSESDEKTAGNAAKATKASETPQASGGGGGVAA